MVGLAVDVAVGLGLGLVVALGLGPAVDVAVGLGLVVGLAAGLVVALAVVVPMTYINRDMKSRTCPYTGWRARVWWWLTEVREP